MMIVIFCIVIWPEVTFQDHVVHGLWTLCTTDLQPAFMSCVCVRTNNFSCRTFVCN